MNPSENIEIGARVEIVQPDYVAGTIGIILGREELLEGESTNRWLIRVIDEDVILSLTIEEFRVLTD